MHTSLRFLPGGHQQTCPPDAGEPVRVAEAAARMGLEHVVVTMVARDDLADGGADMVAATVGLLRSRLPSLEWRCS